MALKKLYIDGVVGLTYVEHTDLNSAAEIILVLREGKPLKETASTPAGREFKHAGSESRIYVDESIPIGEINDPDPGGTTDLPRPEVFYIEYKS